MGTWSHTILGNDTSCEVRERFIELYNENWNCEKIKKKVLNEQSENLELDPTNVWLGFALICWETKCLDPALYKKIQEIVESGEDIEISKELGADSDFIKKREKELDKLLQKISKPKIKSRRRVSPPKQYDFKLTQGDIVKISLEGDLDFHILIVKSQHTKFKGEIQYINLTTSKTIEPVDFLIPIINELGPEWGNFKFKGKSYSLTYDKTNKDSFLKIINARFLIERKEKRIDFSRMVFNSNWHITNYDKPKELLDMMEQRFKADTNNYTGGLSINNLIESMNE